MGLEVHATGFANDLATVYNYTYGPISDYLQFINNSQFSVDGLVSHFPHTASSALGNIINSLYSSVIFSPM